MKFKVVITSYNNVKWVEPCLASIINQTDKDWEILFVDDYSTDGTFEAAREIARDYPNIKVYQNTANRSKAFSFFFYTKKDLLDDDVLVFLDGDDWLADEFVLEKVRKRYEEGAWLTYSKFINYPTGIIGYPQGTEYSEEVKQSRLYRRDLWRPSHLKTMKGFLWKAIDTEDFKDKEEWIRFADDLVFMFAALEMTPSEKVGFMDEVLYVYNASDENQIRTISDATNQLNKETEIRIRNRKPYELYQHKS
jgi:glycosyltransferase involved in cell wall biosynthesis